MNTKEGTVIGEACGSNENIEKFKQFLNIGSPKSKVKSVNCEEL